MKRISLTQDEAKDAMQRLLARVRIDEQTGCHEWLGAKTDKGYGSVRTLGILDFQSVDGTGKTLTLEDVTTGQIVRDSLTSQTTAYNAGTIHDKLILITFFRVSSLSIVTTPTSEVSRLITLSARKSAVRNAIFIRITITFKLSYFFKFSS